MINAYILLTTMAIILIVISYRQGNHVEGLKEAKNLFINVLPMLVCAFVIVGFISVLIPRELLQNLLGAEAGLKGIAIGTVIGALFQADLLLSCLSLTPFLEIRFLSGPL